MCAARSDNIKQRAPHRLEKPSTPVIFEVMQTAANRLNESAMRVIDRASEDEGTLRGSWAVGLQAAAVQKLLCGAILEVEKDDSSGDRVIGFVLHNNSPQGVQNDGTVGIYPAGVFVDVGSPDGSRTAWNGIIRRWCPGFFAPDYHPVVQGFRVALAPVAHDAEPRFRADYFHTSPPGSASVHQEDLPVTAENMSRFGATFVEWVVNDVAPPAVDTAGALAFATVVRRHPSYRVATAAAALVAIDIPSGGGAHGQDKLRHMGSFVAGLAGLAGEGHRMARLFSAAAKSPGAAFDPYRLQTIEAAVACTDATIELLALSLTSGAAQQTSESMRPTPGAPPLPAAVAASLAGGRMASVIKAIIAAGAELAPSGPTAGALMGSHALTPFSATAPAGAPGAHTGGATGGGYGSGVGHGGGGGGAGGGGGTGGGGCHSGAAAGGGTVGVSTWAGADTVGLRPAYEVVAHFCPVAALPAAGGAIDPIYMFRELSGGSSAGAEKLFDTLASARQPARPRTGLLASAPLSAVTDLRRIASYVDGAAPHVSLHTWDSLARMWALEGPQEAAVCCGRVELLVITANEWKTFRGTEGPTVTAARTAASDLPVGASSDMAKTLVPTPTDAKARQGKDDDARRLAVPLGVMAAVSTAQVIEDEWRVRQASDRLPAFAEAGRLASQSGGRGAANARYLASNGRLAEDNSGTSQLLATSLTLERARMHTDTVRRGTSRIGAERVAVDSKANGGSGERAGQNESAMGSLVTLSFTSFDSAILLYGGDRPAVRTQNYQLRAIVGAQGARWGDSALQHDCGKALKFLDSVWTDICVVGLGMRRARRSKFRFRDDDEARDRHDESSDGSDADDSDHSDVTAAPSVGMYWTFKHLLASGFGLDATMQQLTDATRKLARRAETWRADVAVDLPEIASIFEKTCTERRTAVAGIMENLSSALPSMVAAHVAAAGGAPVAGSLAALPGPPPAGGPVVDATSRRSEQRKRKREEKKQQKAALAGGPAPAPAVAPAPAAAPAALVAAGGGAGAGGGGGGAGGAGTGGGGGGGGATAGAAAATAAKARADAGRQREAALVASDMATFNGTDGELTDAAQCFRVFEQLVREDGTFDKEPCPKRACRPGHGDCFAPAAGSGREPCRRCPESKFDAAKEMPMVKRIAARCSADRQAGMATT